VRRMAGRGNLRFPPRNLRLWMGLDRGLWLAREGAMKNQSLQHDAALAAARAIMDQLKDELPHERHVHVMHLLYYSFKSGLEKYESMASRREHRLRPSNN
jgi:hypothetical protein